MFEPLAGRLEDLDSRVKHDQIVHSTLHDIALSDETGTTEIKIIDCPVWRLDDYIAKYSLPQPDFIKIDAQAGELKILKDAEGALKECSFLFLEV